jgi:hypothetical protein
MSCSENRQRTKLMTVRLLPEEHDRLRLAAEQEGLSISELVLALMQRSAPGLIRRGEATRIAS